MVWWLERNTFSVPNTCIAGSAKEEAAATRHNAVTGVIVVRAHRAHRAHSAHSAHSAHRAHAARRRRAHGALAARQPAAANRREATFLI